MEALLNIKDLKVDLQVDHTYYPALLDVDVTVHSGQTVGIVGESGSGKSLLAKTIMGILPEHARVNYSQMSFNGEDLFSQLKNPKTKIRGKNISMIFQDSGSSLNPLMKVGKQIEEVLDIHQVGNKKIRKEQTLEMLEKVGFSQAQNVYRMYPHEMSGGMRQRMMICMALISEPKMIIADEPTTALDTTIQKQILTIMKRLIDEKEKSLVMISHDLGVINEMCDYMYVMYAGKIVESGEVSDIMTHPKHPYTQALLRALPSIQQKGKTLFTIPFQVASLKSRHDAKWPYIQSEDPSLVHQYFPESLDKEDNI